MHFDNLMFGRGSISVGRAFSGQTLHMLARHLSECVVEGLSVLRPTGPMLDVVGK